MCVCLYKIFYIQNDDIRKNTENVIASFYVVINGRIADGFHRLLQIIITIFIQRNDVYSMRIKFFLFCKEK